MRRAEDHARPGKVTAPMNPALEMLVAVRKLPSILELHSEACATTYGTTREVLWAVSDALRDGHGLNGASRYHGTGVVPAQ